MKEILTILVLLVAETTFGQSDANLFPKTNIYGNIINLTRIDSVSENMIIGNFHISDGYCGSTYRFDTSLQFKQNHHCCISDSIIDSGYWLIRANNTVVLKSSKTLSPLYVVKLNSFYFLIQQDQRQAFIKDLQETVFKVNKKKPFKRMESVTYRSFLVCQILSQKYYSKKLAKITDA